ncbi:MAG: conjugal transfer protein TraG N-terminal domain-containing protein [Candidatus Desulfaltia sp.]|nr:conjugal transfer protein TraG N-terminal domain-containing protein [Candidatus Desulfaltia sp.]
MRKTFLSSVTFLFLGLIFWMPATVYADIPDSLKTLTVYGELPYVVHALQRVALIMSDARYHGLFFGIMVMLLIGGVIMVVAKQVLGAKLAPVLWLSMFGTVFAGVIVYHTFIKNTSTILVTDETLGGKFESVSGVPDGIAFLLGMMNKIESGIVDIIWTSGNVEGYRDQAGGIGFNILDKAFQKGVDLSMLGDSANGKYMNTSIRKYIENCLLFEVGRPGSTINVNDINNNTDLVPVFEKADSPSIYTTWYDSSKPAGQSVSCDVAWNSHIKTYLTGLTTASTAVVNFWDQRCAQANLGAANYGGTGGSDIGQVCKTKGEDLLNFLLSTSGNSATMMKQYLLASELDKVIKEGSADEAVKTYGDYTKGRDLIGFAIILNEWMPTIKGVYCSIFLGLIPFVCLLVPTPLCGRALTFIFGSFFFLAAWGICDAIIHSMAMDYAVNSFREIAQGQMGLKSMIMFESESAKAMAAFGGSRMMSLMMAGTMSNILIKFGGSAFAHMLSQTANSSDGIEAAKKAIDPIAHAAAMKGPAEAMPVQAVAGGYSFRDRVTAGATSQFSQIETNLGAAERLGGGMSGPVGGMTAGIRSGQARSLQTAGQVYSREQKQFIAAQTGRNEDRVEQSLQRYQVNASESRASAVEQLAHEWEKTPHEVMRLMEKAKIGDFKGLKQAYDSAKETGFKGSIDDFTATMARVDKMGGFENSAAVEKFAKENGFPGTESFLKTQAEYRRSQDASMIKGLQEQSADGSTGDIGAVLGRAQAEETMAKHDYIQDVGKDGVYLQSAGKLYNEASKIAVRQALDDIAKTGRVSGGIQNLLKRIEGSHIGRAMLAAQGIGDRIIKPDEAQNFSSWLGSRGTNVDAKQLEGATAQMNVWADKRGNLQPSLLLTKKGEALATMNYATNQVALSSKEQVKAFTGKEGDPGMYTVRSTPEGSVVAMEGKGGFRASTSNVILRENADSKGYHLEKVSPETGKAVRGHTESGASATTYNDHDQLKGGTDIDRNTMMNTAISGQDIAANRIINAPTVARREQEEIMQARALAEGLGSIVSKKGKYATFVDTGVGGSLSVGIPGGKLTEFITGVGVKGQTDLGIGQRNAEEYNYNLFYGMIRRMQETAHEKSMQPDGIFDHNKYRELYTSGIQDMAQGVDALSKGKSEFSFGASSIVGSPYETMKSWGKEEQSSPKAPIFHEIIRP